MFITNLHTILLILGINKLMLGLLIFFLKTQIPDFKGLKHWAYGSLLTAIGIIIYAFMPHAVPVMVDFTYSFLLNIFVVTGDCLFLAGFWLVKGKPVKKSILYAFPILTVFVAIVFTLIFNILWLRYSLNAFIGSALYLISAIEIRKSPRKSLDKIFKFSSAIYLFFFVLQLIRGTLGVFFKPVDPVQDSVVSVVLIAIAGVLMILLVFNLILIITTTINDELSEQIRSKNKLYAIISHDLRGPLGNLFNYVRLLKTTGENPENDVKSKYIDEMVRLSSSSRFLLENLFNWSRSQLNEITVQAKEHDLAKFIEENISMIKAFSDEKNIRIVFEKSKNIKAFFDADMMGIVIRNILMNAIKFTNKGGKVLISAFTGKNFVEVHVEDNGIGIDEHNLKIIFDEKVAYSSRGTAGEKGSGFGLLVCKEFIEKNGGTIKVESTPSVGTILTFSIPILNE